MSQTSHFEKLEAEILELLQVNNLLDHVAWDRLASVKELVVHGEYGVAIENLCENLFDAQAPVTREWRARLTRVVADLELDQHYIELVRRLPEA